MPDDDGTTVESTSDPAILRWFPRGSVVTDAQGEWWFRAREGWLYHGEGRGWSDDYLAGQGPIVMQWSPE